MSKGLAVLVHCRLDVLCLAELVQQPHSANDVVRLVKVKKEPLDYGYGYTEQNKHNFRPYCTPVLFKNILRQYVIFFVHI